MLCEIAKYLILSTKNTLYKVFKIKTASIIFATSKKLKNQLVVL
jgi:hypothetical protein